MTNETLHGLSLVAGGRGAAGGPTFRAHDPAAGTPLGPVFHEATEAEVGEALSAAVAAFATYREQPAEARARLLEAVAAGIEGLGDALIARAQHETGLPAARLQGERGRTCAQLRLFAGVVREGSWVDARIDTALPARQPLPRPDLRRMLIPVGPVVVFGASNFPLAFSVAGGDTASAFAAGCPVVVKAHPAHPGTSEMVGEAIGRAVVSCGLPAGLFSLLHGAGPTIGVALVKHPATTAVGFTGSHGAGRALFDAASARSHPIPVFAEMSSLNPVFLLPGAMRERGAAIAQGLLGSFTLGVGQFCTKPGLVFAVRSPETDAFLETLAASVKAAVPGVMLTPAIRAAFAKNKELLARHRGVSSFAETQAPAVPGAEGRAGVATVDAADFLAQPELSALEVFGPFTLVVLADSADRFVECARVLEGQLTATVHGGADELAAARPLFVELERKAGRVLINGFPTGVEVSPAMHHGGPYPAASDARFTSVGTAAILRFARPVCYQNFPETLLPPALRNANPLGLMRLVDGRLMRDALE